MTCIAAFKSDDGIWMAADDGDYCCLNRVMNGDLSEDALVECERKASDSGHELCKRALEQLAGMGDHAHWWLTDD